MEEEIQQIDLVGLINDVIKRWWIVLLCVVLASGISYYYTKNYITPWYKTSTTLFIAEEANALLSGVSSSDISLDSSLINDYMQLIRTRMVANAIIDDLNLDMSTGRLISGMDMDSASGSRFVYLSYTDTNPERAAMLANRYAEELEIQVREVIGADNVQIIDYAIVPYYPVGPDTRREVLKGGILGLGLSLAIIFLLILLDDKIKSEDDVEKLIDTPVLGVIPKFKGV